MKEEKAMSQSQVRLNDDSHKLAELANEAVRAFREENPDAFKELIAAYKGKSADVALFGHGKFSVAVSKGELEILAGQMRGSGATGRGATTPETLMAILEGRITPMEAYFKNDLVARAESAELHKAYDYFVRFSDTALRSKKLQNVLVKFRETFAAAGSGGNVPKGY
jgi:hypothetical protein